MASTFRAFLNSPVGPKTTHFWGPVANWGFVAAVCVFTLIEKIHSTPRLSFQLTFCVSVGLEMTGACGHE